jgi:hypothetical protein
LNKFWIADSRSKIEKIQYSSTPILRFRIKARPGATALALMCRPYHRGLSQGRDVRETDCSA